MEKTNQNEEMDFNLLSMNPGQEGSINIEYKLIKLIKKSLLIIMKKKHARATLLYKNQNVIAILRKRIRNVVVRQKK